MVHFLAERANTPAVLGAIAAHGANNLNNVAEFLQAEGAHYGLPSTMTALEQEWLAQLALKY